MAPPHPSGNALPQAIQLLHMALAEHPDPAAKQTIAVCLQNLLKVQASDMQQQHQQQSPAAQSVLSTLGGNR